MALLLLVTIATNTDLPTIGCYATSTVGYHARNSTGVVRVSMEPFDHGYLVRTRVLHINDGLGRTRYNIFGRFQMGKPTIGLAIFRKIGEDIRVYVMSDHSG
jgi:hypothetical protein